MKLLRPCALWRALLPAALAWPGLAAGCTPPGTSAAPAGPAGPPSAATPAACGPAPPLEAAAAAAQGRALYQGQRPLQGRIAGHPQALPPAAAACAGCHQAARSGPVPSLAPRLTAAYLLQPRPRRNGPPSAYNAASLCAALRSGVDPAFVTLLRSMPRYDLTDAQCDALWAYLTTPLPKAARHDLPPGPSPAR
ncbi:c-type cytochrome [Eleftheria terrae]|uniref:c-type cytochrome n=1 Tax=Eleftheria terrae TaxID=1597781 RepID=UPI00263AEF62|nr:c-type cytochrome [Eleftheria terrae]WKB51880.1 c-type cytochrome [Eleftheria terrae]